MWLTVFGATMLLPAQAQESAIEQASVRDWSGTMNRTTLADGSVLSEYTAFTRATNVDGAQLQVVFTPRFACTPMIRVLLPDDDASETLDESTLSLMLDQDPTVFPHTQDRLPGGRLLAFSANAERQAALLQQLDVASHLTLPWTGDPSTATETQASHAGTVHFSLLGSQRSAAQVRSQCTTHVPIPFTLETGED